MFWHALDQRQCVFCKFRGNVVVIAGDPDQIDNRFLDKYNNGLSYAADKFKDSSLAAMVTLENDECTRSKLAMEASRLL